LGFLLFIYGETTSRIIRKRASYILVVMVLIYSFVKNGLYILSLQYVETINLFYHGLNFKLLFPDKNILKDARIRIGFEERVLYMSSNLSRKIIYMIAFDVANILTSLIFIKKIRAVCISNMIILTNGTYIIGLHAEFLT
jgi:hypothetical protein